MDWTESTTARTRETKMQAKRQPPIRNSSKYRRSYSSPASRVSATVLTLVRVRVGVGVRVRVRARL
eukprot:scaffold19829_cov41-Phaeocystis_antarctica.AAC.2